MDTYPISSNSLEKFYHINGDYFGQQYKEKLSGYTTWEEASHADRWLVFPENIGPRMSIDETSLSDGELYTVLTNKDRHGQKGALAAIVAGTRTDDVRAALDNIPKPYRDIVEEITMDLSASMRNIAVYEFANAKRVIDRFHIQKLACDAIQEMRIKHRWEALDAEHERKMWVRETGEAVMPEVFENGDTRPQLLARSRYLLFKSREKWTASQKARAKALFEQYPDLKTAYDLTDGLRLVFSNTPRRSLAATRMAKWYAAVEDSGFKPFSVIAQTFFDNEREILDHFEKWVERRESSIDFLKSEEEVFYI